MAASNKSAHDRRKQALSQELDSVLKAAVGAKVSSKNCIPPEITQNLCNVVEAVFIHGLRDPFFLKGSRYAKYPEPNFWPFVSKYSHRSITSQINALNQIRSEIGKGRAWVRIVLNEGSLEHYVQLLIQERRAVNQFYHEHAYLRDVEQVERMKDYLKGMLGRCGVGAPTNSSFLNTWTPSPLILAGLVDGQPIRVGQLPPRRLPSDNGGKEEEVGVNALDLVPVSPISPIPHRVKGAPTMREREKRERERLKSASSDDDNASVYSHPSMVDRRGEGREKKKRGGGGGGGGEEGPMSSTPVEGGVMESGLPLLVQRRVLRPRKSSRSSSESRSRSETGSTIGGLLEEGGKSVPDAETRIQQSETLDSGIESEAVRESTSASVVDADLETTKEEEEEKEADRADDVFSENEQEKERSVEEEKEKDEISEMATLKHGSNELEETNPFKDDVDEKEQEEQEEREKEEQASQSEGRSIEVLSLSRDTSVLGTSLHDELTACGEGGAWGGNSLLGRGWAIPTGPSSCDDVSEAHSSSIESATAVVSFGAALRKAIRVDSDSSLDEEKEQKKTEEEKGEEEKEEGGAGGTERKRLGSEITEEDELDMSDDASVLSRLLSLPKEKGLDAQAFRCPVCRRSIGGSFGEYRVCALTARYYCTECMGGCEESPIPARLVASWDSRPRRVSIKARSWLDRNGDRAVVRLDEHAPALYQHSKQLALVKDLRERLQSVSLYLFSCRDSVAEDLKRRVWPKQYLYEDVHLYSFHDLLNTSSGVMERQLSLLLRHCVGHVAGCGLCRQKGFVCEMCDRGDVIYPFQTDIIHRCRECFSVFHRDCAEKNVCPKCARKSSFAAKMDADCPDFE